MPTGDIIDLLTRYGGGRGPTEIARDSGGLVLTQSVQGYMAGTARHASLPSLKVIHGLSLSLHRRNDTEVLLAFGRSCRLNLDAPTATLVTNMPRGIEVLDAYPALVTDIHQMIASMVHTLTDQETAAASSG